jgi:hypothetical protein
VARVYLEESGRGKELGSFGRSAAIGAGTRIAEAYLEEMLTPKNVATLLRGGQLPIPTDQPVRIDGRLPNFNADLKNSFYRVFLSSGFDGPTRFVIHAGDPKRGDAGFGLAFALQGLGWRLVELKCPR